MPPKTPEQLQEDFRKRQQRLPGIQQTAPQLQRPKVSVPVTTNYMGPPEEQPAKPEEQTQAGPTGFVGFGQYQAANVDAAERMAQAVGQQAMATGTAGLVGTEAGRQALLQRAYGGASELDAALAGAAAPSYLQQLEAEYGPAAQQRREQQRREAMARSQQMQQEQAARDVKTQQAAQTEERRRAGMAGGELQRDFWASQATPGEISSEAARIRQEDAGRPRGQMGAERWANLNGLTLEQWIRRGKQPAL